MIDIHAWLERNGLGKYSETFAQHDVDLEVLPDLSDADLQELGVSLGHRRKIQRLLAGDDSAVSGRRLAAPPLGTRPGGTAEHRQLSVLFCDLADSTSLSRRLDVEVYRDLLLIYQQTCTSAIEAYGGYIARVFGDGMLAYFGYPTAHEDDSERAGRAALELLDAVARLPGVDKGTCLQVRIGIATGPVVVGDIVGAGASQESAVLGETPNLAARLQSLASPGSIVVCGSTRQLAGAGFVFEDIGTHELKGMGAPVPAWRLLRVEEAVSRFERIRGRSGADLVGRDEEVALLLSRWRQVCSGAGQVVFLGGEAGIGKSRLMSALRAALPPESHTQLTYQCSPFHGSTALHPVIVQLRDASGIRRDDTPGQMTQRLRAALRGPDRALDGAVALLGELIGIALDDELIRQLPSPAQRKYRTLQILVEQLAALQNERPVLLLFEDVHWIDPTTAELLDLVIPWAVSKRVLMLVSHRPEFHGKWEGEAHVTHLSLRKLPPTGSTALIRAVAGKPLPDSLLAEIVDKADGIPLFVEELTKAVIESDLVRVEDEAYILERDRGVLTVPSTLQASLMARLDGLGQAKEVAQIGAVIGREFEPQLLQACCGLSSAALDENLARLEDAGLISRRGARSGGSYLFKHALLQDCAYKSLLVSRREAMHQRVAAQLQAQDASTLQAQPEVIAYHLSLGDDVDGAVKFWHRAARKAIAQSAMREAYAHISRATDALAGLPQTVERQRVLLELLIEKVTPTLSFEGYSSPALESLYHQAMPLYQVLGGTPDILPLLYARWAYAYTSGQVAAARDRAFDFLEVAGGQGAPALESVGHRLSGVTLVWDGDAERGVRHLSKASAIMDDQVSDDLGFRFGQDGLTTVNTYAAFGHCALGALKQGLACADAAMERSGRLGHALTIAYAHQHLGLLYAVLGDADGLDRCRWVSTRSLAEEPMREFETSDLALQGIVALREGDSGRSRELIGQALRRSTTHGFHLWRTTWLGFQARACLLDGNVADAQAAVARALEYMGDDEWHWCEAELLCVRACILATTSAPEDSVADAFTNAIETARNQPNRIFELRAATEFARFAMGRSVRTRAMAALRLALASVGEPADLPTYREALTLSRRTDPS